MILKLSKTIICLFAVLCLLGNSSIAFAVDGDLDFDFNIQPEIPTTQEEITTVETQKETEKETEKQTEKETEKETTEKPTKKPIQKPTKPHTTEKREEPEDNNANINVNNSVEKTPTTQPETTEEESTDPPLPNGAFYVYLERNNGQRRLKTILNKKGYVPEPEEPVRAGYVFEGWYSDPDFKNEWNFLKDQTDKTITIYAKWAAEDGTVEYKIVIEQTTGGKIQVNPQKARLGEPVVITVTPDDGKRLVQGSILINGKPTDFLSFVMPKGKVTISAQFEDIPENEHKQEKSTLPIYLAIGVVFAVILIIAIIANRRKRNFIANLDTNEVLIFEDNYSDTWIDETIIVEDGFKDGKKVVENAEPDYGAPDPDENDI